MPRPLVVPQKHANTYGSFTVSHSASFSYRGGFSEIFTISLKVSTSDYEKAITFIRDLITSVTFSAERLSVLVAKQLQELPYEKRNGNGVARAWANRLTFDVEKSTSECCGLLNMLEWLPGVAEKLSEEKGSKEIVGGLEEARGYCE
jgi:Zn-dependent M16 (insulinase) family peptidase